MRWLVGLAGMLAIGAAAAPAPRTVAPGTFSKWTSSQGRRSWTAHGVTATLAASAADDGATPVLTVRATGRTPFALKVADSIAHDDTYIGIGPMELGSANAVVLRGWTGGAHCCTHLIVVEPHRGGFRAIDFGTWDDDLMDWPRDRDGDGVVDFVLKDKAFISAFSCVACSWLPPQVMTMRDGKAVNVSTKPAFRPLFAADMTLARRSCFARGDDFSRDACAGFLADAARLNRFAAAWTQFTTARIGWNGRMPAGGSDDFADTVRAFLREHAYIR